MRRLDPCAGIAIGPILFVIALLGVLATAMSSNMSNFGATGAVDRISADISSQANLIRMKINECNLRYGSDPYNNDGYPASTDGLMVRSATCAGDETYVGTGKGNLWSGARPAMLPPPTAGFGEWYYVNDYASGGERCIYTAPTSASTSAIEGVKRAVRRFTSTEARYSTTSGKVVIMITPQSTQDSKCTP